MQLFLTCYHGDCFRTVTFVMTSWYVQNATEITLNSTSFCFCYQMIFSCNYVCSFSCLFPSTLVSFFLFYFSSTLRWSILISFMHSFSFFHFRLYLCSPLSPFLFLPFIFCFSRFLDNFLFPLFYDVVPVRVIFCPYGDNPYKRVGCDFYCALKRTECKKESLKNEFYLV